jgi:hypothetical protein
MFAMPGAMWRPPPFNKNPIVFCIRICIHIYFALLQIQDPWLARSTAHEASLQSARKPFKFVAEKTAALSSPRHRSPRATSRDSTAQVEERLDSQRADVACLYVAERFRSFLKRANARKPDWL